MTLAFAFAFARSRSRFADPPSVTRRGKLVFCVRGEPSHSKLNIACSKKMAVVNICRPAWKGPRVTRMISLCLSLPFFLSLSLSLSLSSLSLFFSQRRSFLLFTVREMSLSKFLRYICCREAEILFFLFLVLSRSRTSTARKIILARRSKTRNSSHRAPPNPQ